MSSAGTTPHEQELVFEYKNWRGELSVRRVLPLKIWFGASTWHPEEQWFMQAKDLDKSEVRDFALVDIMFARGESD
ncbi:hypothetical protein [Paracoccus sp. N5]|uniref:hypothetical protein n=1 Tax=Paracoccus sp. N5 TaxID=1101189 RepID=UPI00037AEA13|nr:hypothetical protein [Paracoccus sp. N5]